MFSKVKILSIYYMKHIGEVLKLFTNLLKDLKNNIIFSSAYCQTCRLVYKSLQVS